MVNTERKDVDGEEKKKERVNVEERKRDKEGREGGKEGGGK